MQAQSKQSEQRRRKWIAIATAAVAVVGFIALTGGEGDNKQVKRPVAHKAAPQPHGNLVTPKQMVDLALINDPRMVFRVCRAREVAGVQLAFAGFRSGYHGRPHLPSPAALFAEVTSRC